MLLGGVRYDARHATGATNAPSAFIEIKRMETDYDFNTFSYGVGFTHRGDAYANVGYGLGPVDLQLYAQTNYNNITKGTEIGLRLSAVL